MDHADVLSELAGEIGAQFVEGGFLRAPKVRARFGNWAITLDIVFLEHIGDGLRIRAPFVSESGFRFVAYHKGSRMLEAGPMPVVTTGEPEFDRDFGIKTSDESTALALAARPGFRQVVQTLLPVTDSLAILDREHAFGVDLPAGVVMLSLLTHNRVDDVEHTKSLYQSFVQTLDQLRTLGAASDEAPNVLL
jgi:hypothetical protein